MRARVCDLSFFMSRATAGRTHGSGPVVCHLFAFLTHRAMDEVIVVAISSSSGRDFDGEIAFYNGGARVQITVSSPEGSILTFVGTCIRSGRVRVMNDSGGVVDGLVPLGAGRFRLRFSTPGYEAVLWSCTVVG